MKNKYYFFKRLYKDYVIILECKGELKSMGYDKKLMQYIKNKDINYIIVYNDFTIKKKTCEVNNYRKYLLNEFIIDIYLKIISKV